MLWMFMGGGSSDDGGANQAFNTPPTQAQAPAAPGMPGAPAPAAAGGANAPAAPASGMAQPKQATVSNSAELTKLQQTQNEYIAALNKLQMLKLQRDIDEAKTAIATAELNRMTAEKNIADLITGTHEAAPGNSMPPGMPPMTAEQEAAMAGKSIPAPAPTPAPQQNAELQYTVLSVAYGRKWTAVLSAQGKLYNVGVGDTLPPDGSKVIEIDKQGVTIKKGTTTRVLSITSAM
jgi:pyruvate/2-oxoglutarate dehydrogenase complex dihydrolipoamide acyltransferase (E2) component